MDAYEQRLADWMSKHGYVAPLGPTSTAVEFDAADEALRAADRELPGEDYCMLCGAGPQPIREMRLISTRDDPYIQHEEPERRVRACPQCWVQHYGEDGAERN